MIRHEPYTLGIGASHNGAVSLLQGPRIVTAVQEERLSRVKRSRIWGSRPSLATTYCLGAAGISIERVDRVVLCSQQPLDCTENEVERNSQLQGVVQSDRLLTISHHLGHAIGAFCMSGFSDAAVVVIDGLGSPWSDLSPAEQAVSKGARQGWESVSLYHCQGTVATPVEKHLASQMVVDESETVQSKAQYVGMRKFRTLGGMYAEVSRQIFRDGLEGSGKTMSLAAEGNPNYSAEDFVSVGDDGSLEFSDRVPMDFDFLDPWPARRTTYANLAAAVQDALEVAVLSIIRRASRLTGSSSLCLAGGVALNGLVNELVRRHGGFDDLFVIPAAEDCGTALGAAFAGLWSDGGTHKIERCEHDFHGRPYSAVDTQSAIERNPMVIRRHAEDRVAAEVAERLAGGQLIGWFEGGSEFGPRALGHRSILGDPRNLETKSRLNDRVKSREDFRPFAPAVLEEHCSDWFDVGAENRSPFMLRVVPARADRRQFIQAVLNSDGTARVQTVSRSTVPGLYSTIEAFNRLTSVPMLLNTSMNGPGEPIVESPREALWVAAICSLDAIVLDGILAEVKSQEILELVPVRRFSRSQVRVAPGRILLWTSAKWGPFVYELSQSTWEVLEKVDGKRLAASLSPDTRSLRAELTSLQRLGLIEFQRDRAAGSIAG